MDRRVKDYIEISLAVALVYTCLSLFSSFIVAAGSLCDANTPYTHIIYSKMFCQLK